MPTTLVTGASRGVARGIATGRSIDAADLPAFRHATPLRPPARPGTRRRLGQDRVRNARGRVGWLNLSNSESPEFIGRVIAALASDPAILERSGKVLVAAQVAIELGVTDV